MDGDGHDQEDILNDMINDGANYDGSEFLNESGDGLEINQDRTDGSGDQPGREGEDDGSGAGTIVITKSGEVY
jgi:hypothetical protein